MFWEGGGGAGRGEQGEQQGGGSAQNEWNGMGLGLGERRYHLSERICSSTYHRCLKATDALRWKKKNYVRILEESLRYGRFCLPEFRHLLRMHPITELHFSFLRSKVRNARLIFFSAPQDSSTRRRNFLSGSQKYF